MLCGKTILIGRSIVDFNPEGACYPLQSCTASLKSQQRTYNLLQIVKSRTGFLGVMDPLIP